MRRIMLAATFTLLACAGEAQPQTEAAPARVNCEHETQLTRPLEPSAGPYAYAGAFCQSYRPTPFPKTAFSISPDARSVSYVEHSTNLMVASLQDANNWREHHIDLGTFMGLTFFGGAEAVAWSSDSRSILTATQERTDPSNFAITPMRPVRIIGDQITPLPPLRYRGLTLDGLRWVGGEGLALATFGTRGGFYRPEHDDPSPTLAIVDAARGRILDTLPMADIPAYANWQREARNPPYVTISSVSTIALPDGRVRALLRIRDWVMWTQDEAPRVLPNPYPDERSVGALMTPDGRSVLFLRNLNVEGPHCSRGGHCTDPPPQTNSGAYLSLHDIETDAVVWAREATITRPQGYPVAAISPDGRYALVMLATETQEPQQFALISLRDGATVQTFPINSHDFSAGFAREGATIWVSAHGMTVLYNRR